jgi:hypothetical protein
MGCNIDVSFHKYLFPEIQEGNKYFLNPGMKKILQKFLSTKFFPEKKFTIKNSLWLGFEVEGLL